MIYNRTYIDIIKAKKIFTDKIQKFVDLTEDEQDVVDKAFFNLKAVNRITGKIAEIWGFVKGLGGEIVSSDDVREWGEQEIFKGNNFSNIRKNIGEAISALESLNFVDTSVYQRAYSLLNDEYIYTNLNNVEKLLYDIYNIFDAFAIKVKNVLYIFGAHGAEVVEGVLTIE